MESRVPSQTVPVRQLRICLGVVDWVQATFIQALTVIDAPNQFSTLKLANVRPPVSAFEAAVTSDRFRSKRLRSTHRHGSHDSL